MDFSWQRKLDGEISCRRGNGAGFTTFVNAVEQDICLAFPKNIGHDSNDSPLKPR